MRIVGLAKVEEEINEWSIRYQTDPVQALRVLYEELCKEAVDIGCFGGFVELPEAPFLLIALRQLSAQGWAFKESVSCAGAKATEDELRSVWDDETVACSSRQRGLAEQRISEPSNPLHILSSILARFARSAWPEVYEAYAQSGFPLRSGSTARVGRLRGYGDGIVVQAAQAFIESYRSITE